MYTFDAIILEKHILSEKNIRIVVLTQDYGKITLWHKKPITGVDIGDIARVVIRREQSVNRIKSIESRLHLIQKKWTYSTLFAFLEVIKTLKLCTADQDAAPQIFADYQKTLLTMGDCISCDHCQLLQMRIFKHLGSLNPDFFSGDVILEYMYRHIAHTPLERILQSQSLKAHHADAITRANLFSLSLFAS